MNSRRNFLAGLASLLVVPPIIEEVAKGKSFLSLYTPKIFIPSESEILALELERISIHIPKLFDREDIFFKYINQPIEYHLIKDMRIPLTLENKNK